MRPQAEIRSNRKECRMVLMILSRFISESKAQRIVTTSYVVLMGCVFAFIGTMIVPK
jgi:hypothetical protein